MRIRECLGLKFPDEFVIRFFFKERLELRRGRVLELGCGNGNNLALFYQYGYSVTGIDISREVIEQAEHNFMRLSDEYPGSDFSFVADDMQNFQAADDQAWDVVLLASSLYYLEEPAIFSVMKTLRKNMAEGTYFYIRMRTPADFRWGRGMAVAERTWQMTESLTGERGCIVTFYRQEEFATLLSSLWNPARTTWCKLAFENLQNGSIVPNSEFVVWGQI